MRRYLEVLAIAIGSVSLVMGAGVPVLARRPAIELAPPTTRYEIGALATLAKLTSQPESAPQPQSTARLLLIEDAVAVLSGLPTEQIDPDLVHAFGGSLSAAEFAQTIAIQGPESVGDFLSHVDVVGSVSTDKLCGDSIEARRNTGEMLFDLGLHHSVSQRLHEQSRQYRELSPQIVEDVSRVWLRALGARCLIASLNTEDRRVLVSSES